MNTVAVLAGNKGLLEEIREHIFRKESVDAIVFLVDMNILKDIIIPVTPEMEELQGIAKVLEDILVEKEGELKFVFESFLPTLNKEEKTSILNNLKGIAGRLKNQEFFAPYFAA